MVRWGIGDLVYRGDRMIVIDEWMKTLTDKLKVVFGERLLFVGIQGSYQRGEATEDSDIDAVVILDDLTLDDLKQYKDIISTMSEYEKACGFISGKGEIQSWPKHELFQFVSDTRPCYGILDGLLPTIERSDIIEGVKVGVSGLYHSCCHTYLHGEAQALREIYKGAFFILQGIYYLRNNRYIGNKNELLPLLDGVERQILAISMDWDGYQDKLLANPDEYFNFIILWCSNVLGEEF